MRGALVIVLILLGLVAVFALQNPGIVTVRFFHLSGNTSVPVLIIAALGVGVLAGFLSSVPASYRKKRRIRDLEARLAAEGRTPSAPPPPVVP